MDLLTSSRMKDYRRCARLHDLKFRLGYRPIETADELRFGTLIHLGLEAWWLALAAGNPLEAALAAVQHCADPFERVRAEVLLEGYHHRWIEAGLETLGVEVEFRASLTNPATGAPSRTYEQGGKLDAIVRERSTARVLIVEHKTSGEDIGVGSTYWLRLRMDGQVSTYFDGAAALGHNPAACLYDVIGKPRLIPYKATPAEQRETTLPKYKACPECKRKGAAPGPHQGDAGGGDEPWRPCGTGGAFTLPDGKAVEVPAEAGKVISEPPRYKADVRIADETPEAFRARLREAVAENPDRYYQRGEVARLERDLTDFRFDLWQLSRSMREAELAGRAPRNPDGCSMYGRMCSFFDVCSGAASLDDTSRFQRVDNVHPELAAPAAQGAAE